jgi:type I restriction enzyme S subunit
MVVKAFEELVTPQFLSYALKGGINIGDSISGTAQPQITRKSLTPIEIPLPPLAEQKRIVALLDEAFAGIDEAKAKAQASIQSLGTLVVSEFQSLVDKKGFEPKPLPELASHTLGKMLDKKKNTGTTRPYLRNVNVRWFEFDLSDIHEMPIRDEEAARCQARKGDVLMCEGGYPGRCAIWRSDEPVFFQKALHRIRFNEKWMAEWFVNYMHSLDSSGKISEFFTGTGIQHLTGETLSKLEIPVPPKSEIEAYVKKISAIRDETNDLAANESAKLDALSELKTSLLAQAFAGELST